MTVKEAAEALEAALKTVPKLRVYRDPAASLDPPAAVVGPPSLTLEAYCPGPTAAVFPVFAVVAATDRALENLWDLVPQVAAAVEEVPGAVCTGAEAGAYQVGGTQLPAYTLNVEVSL